MTATQETYVFNGIRGDTGEYGLQLTQARLAELVRGETNPTFLSELKNKTQSDFPLRPDLHPEALGEAGWGIIFSHLADPAIQEALSELIAWRREQAGPYFRIFAGDDGYRSGESKNDFLSRHHVAPGMVDPDKGVPYYLLLVGSPADIPYEFQYQLDVQFAVGRIYFDDLQQYANYARSVVAAEKGQVTLPRRAALFSMVNQDDRATQLSHKYLVKPLLDKLNQESDKQAKKGLGWQIDSFSAEAASKAHLSRLLNGGQAPALLFTASHGLEFPAKHPQQLAEQGALVCADWPGPMEHRGPLSRDWYFAAEDLDGQANLLGLIAFHFACFGAGTPQFNEFTPKGQAPAAIAPYPFVAALPTKMLGLAQGGALAVVGHIERAWGQSIVWPGVEDSIGAFEITMRQLLKRFPLGYALEAFNLRYAELATEVTMLIDRREPDLAKLTGLWTAHNDARNYIILGDPAVRLPVAEKDAVPTERTVIEVKPTTLPTTAPTALELQPEVSAVNFSLPIAGDEVHFSAYHPRALTPGEWRKLLVYAHLDTAAEAVAIDAGQIMGKTLKAYRQAQATSSLAIIPGTEITLVPQAEGLEFNPPQARLTWANAWQRADFELRATSERAGHVVSGAVACYVGPLLVAEVKLALVVASPTDPVTAATPLETQSAKMYQAVFASYSHADTAVVEAVEKAYQALGMDYLRDVMTLKSGQSWSDELLRMIDRADIFQLFWSPTASQSAYVEQEWRHALALVREKGSAFIRPVYWTKPIPSVPTELSRIHFAPVDFAGLTPTKVAQVTATAVAPATTPLGAASPLAALLPTAAEAIKTLTISTYSGDPAQPAAAKLLAQTHLALDGEVTQYLPEKIEVADKTYLELHQSLVQQALEARLAYLKLIAQIAAGGTATPENR